jgi:O-methyltransferase
VNENFRPFVIHLKEAMRACAFAVMYAYEAEVEGDVVEFGTMSGNTAKEMAGSMKIAEACASPQWWAKHPKMKRLHLFDSFEGFPNDERDADAPHVQSSIWRPGNCKGLSQTELVERVIRDTKFPIERVKVHAGWFKDTVKDFGGRVSVVNIDCDLYSSTMDALLPLFNRNQISDGCAVLFDDFNCNRASPSHGQRKAWGELKHKFGLQVSDEGSYGIFGRKFIVHGS